MGSDPGHFPACDHTARHRFKEEFTECHDTDSAEPTLGPPLDRCMTCSIFFMPAPPAFPSDLLFSVRHQVRCQERVDAVTHLGLCAQFETLSGLFVEPLLGISNHVVDPGNQFVELVVRRLLWNQSIIDRFFTVLGATSRDESFV